MSIEIFVPRTKADFAQLQIMLSKMTLAQMLAYYQGRLIVAETPREKAFVLRQITKVRKSIALVLGA